MLGDEIVGSRRVYVLFPAHGPPTALVHAVDAELWRGWPSAWPKQVWVTREQLTRELGGAGAGPSACGGLLTQWRHSVPRWRARGVAEPLGSLGATLVSSVELVTRYCSVMSPADVASHRRAAEAIAGIAREALALAGLAGGGRTADGRARACRVGAVAVRSAGLVTESGPSASWGPNAARAHDDPTAEESAPIAPGALLLLDLWAKEPDGIYADQTWMAAIGLPAARDGDLWTVVRDARDAALEVLERRIGARPARPRGRRRRGGAARHRSRRPPRAHHRATGHSIDRYGLHGFGPPIDDTETYDDRLLIPGVGFSVEPGVYLPGEAGVRSEVNVVVGEGEIIVTPAQYQRELLVV